MEATIVEIKDALKRIFIFLDGRKATRGGIEGRFRRQIAQARYPYPHTKESLIWEPTAKGRRSEVYLATKRELGDDWDTDLTDAIEEYCEVAVRLGFK